MTKEQLEKCSNILNHFGTVNQMVKTIEECSELSVQLAKAIPNYQEITFEQKKAILSECADVLITVNQVAMSFATFNYLDEEIDYKLNRTLERYEIKEKELKGNDMINKPLHYTKGKIECVDYIIDKKLDFLEGNIVKYVTRWKHKNGLEDLKKAQWYMNKLVEKEELK
jgi:hypothetical protein